MTQGPGGPKHLPTPEERRRNREKARSGSPGALPARGPAPEGGVPGKKNWWSRQSTAAKIVLIVVGVIILIGVIGVATGGGKKGSNNDNSAAPAAKARVVILARRSKCWEVPTSARVFAQVYVRNRGNASGKVDAWLAIRYSDSGNAVEEAPDTFTIEPGTLRVAYIAHDYNALQHDVIECSASLDSFDHSTPIRVLAPE
jgi:hypothetical protein